MGRRREQPDVITRGLGNLTGPLFLNLINAHDGVQWNITALDSIKGSLEFLFARVHQKLASLTEDKLFYFNKTPEFTLEDLTGVYFKYLTLVLKNHTKNGGFCHRVLLPR